MNDTKHITSLGSLNIVFKYDIVPKTVADDVKQRILDWLENPDNTINDPYVLNQCAVVERTIIASGYDLSKIFKND